MSHSPSFSRRFLLRGVVGAGASIAVAGLLPVTNSFAQTIGDERAVTVDGVRLRSGAGTGFSVLATLSAGAKVTVVSTVSQSANGYVWFNVKSNSSGTTGWIATEFLTDGGSSNPNWPAGTDVYVTNGPLNLRSSANGSVIKTVPTGAGATTTGGYETAGGYSWVSVELDSGEEGWFASDFIAKGSGSTPGTGWPAGTAVFVDNASLNLRKGASLGSSVLDVYPYGTNAEILSGPTVADGYNWYRVEVYSDGAIGYFIGEGLAKGTTSPTTDRIRVVDGPVNLRSEPGLNKSVLDTLSTGEGGDIWSTASPTVDGYTWVKIRVDSTQEIGWLATSFINFV